MLSSINLVTIVIKMANIPSSMPLFKLLLENEHEIPQTIAKITTTNVSTNAVIGDHEDNTPLNVD